MSNAVKQHLKNKANQNSSNIQIASLLMCSDPTRDIAKNYTGFEQLGAGAFGTVSKCRSMQTKEVRAVKQIPITDVAEDLQYVHAELEAMIALDHPNIVQFVEFFEDNRQIWLVTELCSGGDFGDLNHGIDDPDEVRTLFQDLFRAVSYCHNLGVAHRDLKFENCLIQKQTGERRVTKVIDFGLSAIRRPGDKVGQWLNDQLGTRYFVAPEVIDNKQAYGVKCDNWSVGVMMYIVMTDEHPCSGEADSIETAALFRKVLRGSIRMQPLEDAKVPAPCKDIILKLLVKNPDARLTAQDALQHPWVVSKTKKVHSWHSKSTLAGSGPEKAGGKVALDAGRMKSIKSFQSASAFEKALLTLTAHHSQSKEVDDLRSAFIELDTHGTGSLTRDEIEAGLKSSGQKLNEKDLDDLFKSLDADGTGKIKYTEWLAATMKPASLSSDKAIKKLFTFFDIEQTGKISRDELLQVLGKDVEVSKVLARGDKKGDGCLDEEEFAMLMRDIAKNLESKIS